MKNVTFTISREFGKYRYYPDCDTSKDIVTLAGVKSLTQAQIEFMKSRGWEVEVKADIPA